MDEHGWGYCGLLDHGSLRGQAAKEYGYAPFGMHRFIDSAYDTGVGEGVDQFECVQVLAHPLAGDGQCIQGQSRAKGAHDRRNPSCPLQVEDVMRPARPEVDQMGRLAAELIEALDIEVQAKLRCDRHQVQNCVRRSSNGHVHPDGVIQRGCCDYLAGGYALFHQLHDLHSRELGQTDLSRIDRMGGSASGQGEAHGLGEAGHGIGGK